MAGLTTTTQPGHQEALPGRLSKHLSGFQLRAFRMQSERVGLVPPQGVVIHRRQDHPQRSATYAQVLPSQELGA